MRKLLIAGLAVASLTGIVYAQTADQETELVKWLIEHTQQRGRNPPPTCVDVAGATRQVDETTSIGGVQFRCAETFGGARLQSNGANWILINRLVTF